MDNEQTALYEHLALHEEAISELYRTFGEIFPKVADFWNEMAEQEDSQAKMLCSLKRRYEAGQVQLKECRLTKSGVQYSLDYVNQIIESAKNGEITSLREALAIAYDLENAMIEKEIFALFEESSPALSKVLEKLYEDNQQQRKKVLDWIDKLKSGQDIDMLTKEQAGGSNGL